MGIETNFGKYLGKMDIISSLATLSFDQRRSAFFTNELLILLRLIDKKTINKNILYGSWGAFEIFNLCLKQLRIMQLIIIIINYRVKKYRRLICISGKLFKQDCWKKIHHVFLK